MYESISLAYLDFNLPIKIYLIKIYKLKIRKFNYTYKIEYNFYIKIFKNLKNK